MEPMASMASSTTHMSLFPDELQFLLEPACCPDMTDRNNQKRGNVRQAAEDRKASHDVHHVKQFVKYIIDSCLFQTSVMVVIVIDVVQTALSLAGKLEEDTTVGNALSWTILAVLFLDVGARLYVEGLRFMKSCMNVLEFLLVPLALAEMLALRHLDVPVPLLRVLRPIFRGLRVARVVIRGLDKGAAYLKQLRHVVSGDKVRFTQDRFDLDLAYITRQIIVSSLPAVARDAMFRNPCMEVARFVNERHTNKYLIVNTTQRQSYPKEPFFGRIYHFPISANGVPSLDAMIRLCQVVDAYLKSDPEHIVFVHSRNGQGRACLVCASLLLYRRQCTTSDEVVRRLEYARLSPDERQTGSVQTVDCASQKRFIEWVAHVCNSSDRSVITRRARLRKVQVFGLADASSVNVSCLAPRFGCVVRDFSSKSKTSGVLRPKRTLTQLGGKRTGTTSTLGVGEHAPNEAEAPPPDAEAEAEEEDHIGEEALMLGEEQVTAGLSKILEERTFDSHLSGCNPDLGTTLFSSDANSGVSDGVTTSIYPDDPTAPAVWRVEMDTDLADLRLEFYRKQGPQQKMPEKVSIWSRLRHGAPKAVLDMDPRKKFRGGMFFAIALNTGYLELEELPEMTTHLRHTNQVVVTLDRFGLDKASKAPPLRTYSSSLKVQLEFEVEARRDLRAEMNAQSTVVMSLRSKCSDSYDMGWLTWVMEQVWPSFRCGLEKMISTDIMPSIQQSLPGPLKNIKLTECSLGDGHPAFRSVSACSRCVDGLEVQLDLELEYTSQTRIVLDAGIAAFSINSFGISGLVSLRFKPILSELPVLAALQLLFINPPNIDLKFGNMLEVANWPMAKNIIISSVNSAIYDLMVLPNMICVNWGDPNNDNSVSFTNLMPWEIMRISVVEARGVQEGSYWTQRTPSISVTLKLGQQEARTDSISDSKNPVWNETFDFLVYDERQCIRVVVTDTDFAGRQRIVGESELVPVATIVKRGGDGIWVAAQDTKVFVQAVMYELAGDRETLERAYVGAAAAMMSSRSLHMSMEGEPRKRVLEALDDVQPAPGEAADAGGATLRRLTTSAERSGAIALLVCDIVGCYIPTKLGTADAPVDVRVEVGPCNAIQRAAPVVAEEDVVAKEKTVRSIHRLASHGLQAHQIAESLDVELPVVQRIIRKNTWNFDVVQKFPVLVMPEVACEGDAVVTISLLVKGKLRAQGTIPLERIFRSPTARVCEVITCPAVDPGLSVRFEVDIRPFALRDRAALPLPASEYIQIDIPPPLHSL